MNGFQLDTNCVSELARIRPEPRVTDWVQAAEENLLYLSVLTLGEIRKGATLLPAGNKRDNLERWLDIDLRARFANRILPITGEIAELWGAMAAQSRLKGIALAIIDGLVAGHREAP